MRRAIQVIPHGTWQTATAIATATLPFDERHRRRMRLSDDAGEPFLLDLERPHVLADGDGLLLAEGGVIAVRAAAEPVADVSAASPGALARLAWHIGNRHAPLQVLAEGGLRIRDDSVLISMLKGLGATIVRQSAAFSPEGGAYAIDHRHDVADASNH